MKNSALRQKVGLVWCSVIVQRRLKHKVQGPVDCLPSTINFNDWSTHTYIQWSEVCIRIGSIAKQYIPLYFENFTVMVLLYVPLKDIYIGYQNFIWKYCQVKIHNVEFGRIWKRVCEGWCLEISFEMEQRVRSCKLHNDA